MFTVSLQVGSYANWFDFLQLSTYNKIFASICNVKDASNIRSESFLFAIPLTSQTEFIPSCLP